MQAEWNQLEDLFHAALARREPDRQRFLSSRCSGNESLFNKVKSLLRAYEDGSDLLERSVLEEGFAIIHQTNDTESLVGRKIQNYTLMEKLGEGGMGTVYLAHDGQLDREVALKFISSDYFDSDLLKKRLIREAQAEI